MSDTTEPKCLAQTLAEIAHHKQFRRDGKTPYIKHPEAVANKFEKDSLEWQTAWLHDVLENTHMSAQDLLDAGIDLVVVEAVEALTIRSAVGEEYMDYLRSVCKNPLAVRVKIADMICNLNDTPTRNQICKYARGLLFLLENTHIRI